MIRKSKISDFEQLEPLFIETHKQTSFKNSPIDIPHMKRVFAVVTAMPNLFCEVVEHEGKVVGVLGGGVDKNAWGTIIAMDLFFISGKESHALLRRFKQWAKDNNAWAVHITSLVENDRYDSFLMKMGFKKAGQCFAMEI